MPVGKLYMYPVSPPVRSVLLLEKALGIDLEYEIVNVMEQQHLKEEYLKINPQHTIPSYKDQDGSVMWDSHAIMAYLVTKYSKNDDLYPKDPAQRAIVDQRMHFDSGSCFGAVQSILTPMFLHGERGPTPQQITKAHDVYDFMNTFLEKHPFMAGDRLTIADFCLITSTISLNVIVPIDKKNTRLLAWIKRCEALPYFEEVNGAPLKEFKRIVQELLEKFKPDVS